jgi:lambda family phage portal protein
VDVSDIEELLGVTTSNGPAPDGLRVPPGAGQHMIAGDAYEGASRLSQELASYTPAIRSPDQDIRPAKKMADARSRDLSRNDANLQSGIALRQNGIVGSYFMLNARPNSRRLFGKEDLMWEDEFAEEVEERFAAYAESDDHWVDAGGRHTLTGLTRLAVEQHTIYGECLGAVEWVRERDRPFNTSIQMIDTDRLSTPMNRVEDRFLTMGVQSDSWGKPIGYHIRMAHPSDWLRGQDAMQWKYMPARLPWGRKQMIHIYDQHRPGQTRGIGTMVAAIPEMKMARQFREIVLQNAILNATYAATIESDLDAAQIFTRLGGTDFAPEAIQEAIDGYMSGYYNTLGTLTGGGKQMQIGGVKIPHLPPGSKLHMQGAGQGGPLGSDFEASLNRVMASALGVSYEQFSRDYTKTNYSSGKMASVETYKAMLAIKRAVADGFATTVYRLWFEEAFNAGVFATVRRSMPSFYENQNKDWYCGCDWIGASRGQVDELKETQAAVLRMQNGISDLETENARLGFDWRKRMRQIRREQDWKDFFGILQDPSDTKPGSLNSSKSTNRTNAYAPSVGTAGALFMDDEGKEAVNE